MGYVEHSELLSDTLKLRFLANRIVFLLNDRIHYPLDNLSKDIMSQGKEFVKKASRGEKASEQRSFVAASVDEFEAIGAVAEAVIMKSKERQKTKELQRLLSECNIGFDKILDEQPLDDEQLKSLKLLFSALLNVAIRNTRSTPDTVIIQR